MTSAGADPATVAPVRYVSPLEREAEQARSIESAVLGVDGVVALSAAAGGAVAPPHGVHGIRLSDHQVDVLVVTDYGIDLQSTADDIGRAVAPILGGRALRVSIEDILLPGERMATPSDE